MTVCRLFLRMDQFASSNSLQICELNEAKASGNSL